MIFDNDIKFINDKNKNRPELLSKMQRELAVFEARKKEINSKNLSGEVRNKILQVYNYAISAANEIKRIEGTLPSLGGRFSSALANGKECYEKPNFIEALKSNYEIIRNFALSVAKSGMRAQSDKAIFDFANAYASIKSIKQNQESLISTYVAEENHKRAEIDACEKEKQACQRKWDDILLNDENELQRGVSALRAKIDEFRKAYAVGEFSKEPKIKGTFDSIYKLNIGVAEDTARSTPKVADLSNYKMQSIKVNESNYCYSITSPSKSSANICITYQNEDAGLWKIIESIAMKFIISYPAKFKNIAAVHNIRTNSEFLGIMGRIRRMCDANELVFEKNNSKGVSNSSDEIRHTVQSIANLLDERIGKLYGYDNIIEYNKNNPDNIQPLTLLFVKDLDAEKNEDQIEYLKDIANGGEKVGIFVIWINKEDVTSKVFAGQSDVNKLFGHIFKYEKGLLKQGTVNVDCTVGLEYLGDDWYAGVKKQLNNYSTAIDLLSFNDGISGLNKKDYSRTLYIPIGKQDADASILALDSKDEYCHAVVAGTTGSGKTSLLHSIILGGAYHYSPQELEIWLFDFKQGGVEFNIYKSLKHLKVLALNSHKQDVFEILDYLIDTMEQRGNIIRSKGMQDINGYNNSGVDKKLPRIIVVIDEYTVLANSHKCIAQLEHVAKQGRAYGISLIMSSQEVDNSFSGVIKQMKHRFEFGKTGHSSLIDENYSRFGDITSVKGTCIYQRKQGAVKMRVAYTDKIYDAIQEINKKYPNQPEANPILLENPQVIKKKADLSKVGMLCNKDKHSIRIKIGARNLSRRVVDYKIDADNRFLALFGDEERVKNIEYAIVDSFASYDSSSPSVYYLNTTSGKDDVIHALKDNYFGNSIYVSQRPADVCDALHKLYDIYNERMNMLDDGIAIDHPIEVIIHCFDRLPALLDRIASRMDNNSGKDTGSMFTHAAPPVMPNFFEGFDIPAPPTEVQAPRFEKEEKKEYPSYQNILQTLYSADRECEIYLTLHFENSANLEKYSSYFCDPMSRPDIKDAIIAPSIPKEGDIASYKQIIDSLRAIRQQEFADMYSNRNENASAATEEEKNNFNYYILVDENVPFKFLPYEYDY